MDKNTDKIDCPRCKGKGHSGAFVSRAEEHGGHYYDPEMPCHFCCGIGKVESYVLELIKFGQIFQHIRIKQGDTLTIASEKFGVSVPTVSGIGNGIPDTYEKIHMGDFIKFVNYVVNSLAPDIHNEITERQKKAKENLARMCKGDLIDILAQFEKNQ